VGFDPISEGGALSLDRFLLRMPKAELHVHLEGSMRPATLLKLAARRGIDLPARDEAGLRDWFKFRDFDHFVQIYLTCSRCLRQPEDFQLLVEDFLDEQERQNVRWSEVHFTIGTHALNAATRERFSTPSVRRSAPARRSAASGWG
jgi:adenosine deaminase